MTTILKAMLVKDFLYERFNARDLYALQWRDWAKVQRLGGQSGRLDQCEAGREVEAAAAAQGAGLERQVGAGQLQCDRGHAEASCAAELGGQGGGEGGRAPRQSHPQAAWDCTGPHPPRPQRRHHHLDLINKGLQVYIHQPN